MGKLLSQSDFESKINQNILLLENYKGSKYRISVKCKICNHTWTPFARKLLEGQGCPNCKSLLNRKTNEEFIHELKLINNNIKPLEEYNGYDNKILFECKLDNYKWKTTPSKVLSGKGCPCCAGNAKRTIEDIINILKSKNITLLSKEYKNIHSKINVRCDICKHEWYTEPNVVVNKSCGCPKCYGNIKKTHDEFLSELNNINSKIEILTEYIGANEIITCRCLECKSVFDTTPSNLLRGHGCKHCNHSATEKKVKDILKNSNIYFIYQKTFEDLFGIGGRKLSYDFYIPNCNTLLEIQGQQHYHPVDFGGKGFEFSVEQFNKQKIHDKLKNDYANKNNYKLIEIPYWDFDKVEQILESRLLTQSA